MGRLVKLYGKKFLKNEMRKTVEEKTETRDGICWNVLSTDRIVQVKLQDSTELIYAQYPVAWKVTPTWLKPRAPIRLVHRTGLRNRIEVVGLGQVVPTPIAGGSTFPSLANPGDGVLSGCEVIGIPNESKMQAMIKTGEYQISGSTYSIAQISMESSFYAMGSGGKMGDVAGVVSITSAAVGEYRQDLVVVGTDGVIDVVTGTTFSTAQVVPDVPSGHVELGRILVAGGVDEITGAEINKDWVAPQPAGLTITITDDDLSSTETETDITVGVTDQFGNDILKDGLGWYITMEFSDGNGSIESTAGISTSVIGSHTGATSNECVFTYTRGQTTADESPVLTVTLHADLAIESLAQVTLRNSSDEIM